MGCLGDAFGFGIFLGSSGIYLDLNGIFRDSLRFSGYSWIVWRCFWICQDHLGSFGIYLYFTGIFRDILGSSLDLLGFFLRFDWDLSVF